jgi:hypothetical protein
VPRGAINDGQRRDDVDHDDNKVEGFQTR